MAVEWVPVFCSATSGEFHGLVLELWPSSELQWRDWLYVTW